MRLTGDRAREILSLVLSRDPPGARGGPARFAPPGTPPLLSLSVGVDPDSLAAGVDLRAGSRRASVGADLDAGPSPALLRESLSRIGAPEAGLPALGGLVLAAWRAFLRLEAIEIHAEAMLTGGEAVFGACALRLDPRALLRHPEVESCLADTLDRRLARAGIDYVGLEGDVGILCIGAGMTLSMIDRLRDAGARPAAFLDVSRNISADGISFALGVLLDHHRARVIVVNVIGGITPMDHLARGLVEALARRDGARVPLVARLEGTGGSAGRAILEAAGISLAADTAEVIAFAVRNTGGGGA